MKIEIKENVSKSEEIKFPVIMTSSLENTKVIIMFQDKNSGIVLYDSTGIWEIGSFQGYLHECSSSDYWKKFSGTITISNDE